MGWFEHGRPFMAVLNVGQRKLNLYIYISESGWLAVDIYYCCYAAGAFSLGSILGPLLGNDIYIKSSLFFGVCSGAVAWQRQSAGGVFSLVLLLGSGTTIANYNYFYIMP
jgi:hypothetical protein